ncbi:hypothetical protein J3L18_30395 [Mucilaginibacter gossypii]|uniref:hypothetical protein n=1 Tax=Mucilaginibacter gossypii TaxID=551996 RepID=UPI000DCD7764|nr:MULTISPECIES: hypothetical protein [Mucilaginibacter]QTE37363.1 hypothetical protein J3L18_30395 [Mucilaginibacter gossypii]RAV57314.1 hypothetical protein DIU36_13485 [Mucilaginibacter rubeus]
MKTFIIDTFTFKTTRILLLLTLLIVFIMFGLNFNRMMIPFAIYVSVISFSLVIATLGYTGFIVRMIYLRESFSKSPKDDSSMHLTVLSLLFGFSVFIAVGMVLPALNYPR